MEVTFRAVHPWAIVPAKTRVEIAGARERARLYREHFRYVRAERQAEFCPPWILGQELGWRIHSPIDVVLDALDQVEINPGSDPEEAVKAAGKSELWIRERSGLSLDRRSWLHLYQFGGSGTWENMFVPNGNSTVEWRLGWTVEGVGEHFLLVLPSEHLPSLHVQTGVFTSAMLERMSTGLSVPIAPRGPVRIQRGQEIARIVLLHPDSVRAQARTENQ